jgi:hypothetical protein
MARKECPSHGFGPEHAQVKGADCLECAELYAWNNDVVDGSPMYGILDLKYQDGLYYPPDFKIDGDFAEFTCGCGGENPASHHIGVAFTQRCRIHISRLASRRELP